MKSTLTDQRNKIPIGSSCMRGCRRGW